MTRGITQGHRIGMFDEKAFVVKNRELPVRGKIGTTTPVTEKLVVLRPQRQHASNAGRKVAMDKETWEDVKLLLSMSNFTIAIEGAAFLNARQGLQLQDAIRRSAIAFKDDKKQSILNDIANLAGEGDGLKVTVEIVE